MKKFAHFLNDESGATAIEYALLAGLIGVGIVTAATNLGDAINTLFGNIEEELEGVTVGE
ncbi:Flp family type IVb pilin [uncultured Cohaesibacter sp.]|uniref:Flp family type IVb pilin n=1 Tax=uncultured Cohaesibacter sp. TaxID=1002546 RepID=UPI00292F4FFB|nr:Flp family type IVb pilin [uncultured Cohaesibacter sp.]